MMIESVKYEYINSLARERELGRGDWHGDWKFYRLGKAYSLRLRKEDKSHFLLYSNII